MGPYVIPNDLILPSIFFSIPSLSTNNQQGKRPFCGMLQNLLAPAVDFPWFALESRSDDHLRPAHGFLEALGSKSPTA